MSGSKSEHKSSLVEEELMVLQSREEEDELGVLEDDEFVVFVIELEEGKDSSSPPVEQEISA